MQRIKWYGGNTRSKYLMMIRDDLGGFSEPRVLLRSEIMFYTAWGDTVEHKNKLVVTLIQFSIIWMLHHCLYNISPLKKPSFLGISLSSLKYSNIWRTWYNWTTRSNMSALCRVCGSLEQPDLFIRILVPQSIASHQHPWVSNSHSNNVK